jgi:hypothetical protein
MNDFQRRILKTALNFVGEREVGNNIRFENLRFEELMAKSGWERGQAWCAYFGEVVYREAGLTQLADLFSGSAVQTLTNIRKALETQGLGNVISPNSVSRPNVGDIFIMQSYGDGDPSWTGHLGIVARVMKNGLFVTVEGNTNSEGGREGIEVALGIRSMADKDREDGLRLIAFIRPYDPATF